MRKIAIAAVTTALTGLGLVVPVTAGATTSSAARPAAAAARSCDIHWGSKPKHAGAMVQAKVRSARAGQHACFDRLVIDIGSGAKPGYRVRYVHRIIADGSGDVIKVRGHARLLINVLAPATASFPANSHHLVNVAGFSAFRQVVGAGSFEGVTSVGVGLRARLPFRVTELRDPGHRTRLVIDVAHHW
jgi:hypothetical protein